MGLFSNSNGMFIGLDVGEKSIAVCVVNETRTMQKEFDASRSEDGLTKSLKKYAGARLVLEAGAHSLWISEHLKKLGFDVVVCDPCAAKNATKGRVKNDRRDARTLAELLRTNSTLLFPVSLRPMDAHAHLAVVRARDQLIGTRTKLINNVRGLLKPFGVDLPRNCADTFARKARTSIPEMYMPAVEGVLNTLDAIQENIKYYDKLVKKLAKEKYPETQRLTQICGVGDLTALAFILTIWDVQRFGSNRSIGAYLGLVPRCHDSGDNQPELRITCRGDKLVRKLLINAAQYILGPFGPMTDLKMIGIKLHSRGGKWAKTRAIVAVARRLAVLMGALWKSGEKYEPSRKVPVAA